MVQNSFKQSRVLTYKYSFKQSRVDDHKSNYNY